MPCVEPRCPKCGMYWPELNHVCYKDTEWFAGWYERLINQLKELENVDIEDDINRLENEGGIILK